MRANATRFVGPGRLPCRYFNFAGNLTGEGVEAQVWAEVDGPALLYYYDADPKSVAALRFESASQLVRGVWAFLRNFTSDIRFDDVSWIDAALPGDAGGSAQGAGAAAGLDSIAQTNPDPDPDNLDPDGRALLAEKPLDAADAGAVGEGGESHGRLGRFSLARDRHGPMRVYRPSATRIAIKLPTGCKYRYSVNPDSRVFESPSRQRMALQWRAIVIAIAGLSVLASLAGLAACTYFSHRHAQYVASYWEYQAVKDHLGSELPPATYQRLFGEPPKHAAEAAAAAEPGVPVGVGRSAGAAGANGDHTAAVAPPRTAANAATAAAAAAAVQQHVSSAAAALQAAQTGEARVVGAGRPDGTSSGGDGRTVTAAALTVGSATGACTAGVTAAAAAGAHGVSS